MTINPGSLGLTVHLSSWYKKSLLHTTVDCHTALDLTLPERLQSAQLIFCMQP